METQLAAIDGVWNLQFQPERGAPTHVTFDKLMSWSESADTGVEYFSGTAKYTRTVNAPSVWLEWAREHMTK